MEGKWKATKGIAISGKDKSVIATQAITGCDASSTYEFKSDKTYTFTFYDDSTGTCKADGSESGTYVYNSSDKTITTTYNGTSIVGKVYSLSSTEMQLVEDEDDYNGDGVTDLGILVLNK